MTNSQTAFWTETQVAEHLNMSLKWLQKMRLSGGGIPFRKFGSSVRYLIADVHAFESAALRENTSQPEPRTAEQGDAKA